MNSEDYKKLVQGYTDNDISADEPHVSMRCQENNISLDEVKNYLLHQNSKLVRVVQDRPKVFKLYYRLSRRQELKIVIDLFEYQKINIRTVKRLIHKFKVGLIKRRF